MPKTAGRRNEHGSEWESSDDDVPDGVPMPKTTQKKQKVESKRPARPYLFMCIKKDAMAQQQVQLLRCSSNTTSAPPLLLQHHL
jgi:hypothetical protein